MRYHLIPVRTAIINKMDNTYWRGCREKGTLIHSWGYCKLVQPLWKIVWEFLQKLRRATIRPPQKPSPEDLTKNWKTFICKDICTPIFTAALFLVAKTWKHPKCPSIRVSFLREADHCPALSYRAVRHTDFTGEKIGLKNREFQRSPQRN